MASRPDGNLSGCQGGWGGPSRPEKKKSAKTLSLRSTACSEDSTALVEGGGV